MKSGRVALFSKKQKNIPRNTHHSAVNLDTGRTHIGAQKAVAMSHAASESAYYINLLLTVQSALAPGIIHTKKQPVVSLSAATEASHGLIPCAGSTK